MTKIPTRKGLFFESSTKKLSILPFYIIIIVKQLLNVIRDFTE